MHCGLTVLYASETSCGVQLPGMQAVTEVRKPSFSQIHFESDLGQYMIPAQQITENTFQVTAGGNDRRGHACRSAVIVSNLSQLIPGPAFYCYQTGTGGKGLSSIGYPWYVSVLGWSNRLQEKPTGCPAQPPLTVSIAIVAFSGSHCAAMQTEAAVWKPAFPQMQAGSRSSL